MQTHNEENEKDIAEDAEITEEEETTENNQDTEILEEETEDETEKLKKQLVESEEKYMRLVAEYDNYRKRTARERDAVYPQATAETVARFLPVLDNFDRALEFDFASEEFAKGIKLIDQNFEDVIKSLGIEPVGDVGDSFDPALHNAVMKVENPDFGENVISKVFQKGYRLGERIIRHAMVEIAN